MAYTSSTTIGIGITGLTVLASFVDSSGTLHASLKNLACTEIGTGGSYRFSSAAIPDSYRGRVIFHTGSLTTLADLTTANNYGHADINPQETENADVKTSTVGGGGGSSGAFTVTVTVTDGADPLEGALVRITTLDGLTTGIADPTDADGEAGISGDALTYNVVVTKDGFETLRTTRTITGDDAGTLIADLEMTAFALPASSDPLLCQISGDFILTSGAPAAGVEIEATLYSAGSTTADGGKGIVLVSVTIILNSDGKVPSIANGDDADTTLLRTDQITRTGCRWSFRCDELRLNDDGVELTATGFDLATLLDP